jgi:myb proto-oncogene protein
MMNYYMESPMMPDNNATFVFDDELFLAYWNSFLFESIGWVWRVGAWERWLVC